MKRIKLVFFSTILVSIFIGSCVDFNKQPVKCPPGQSVRLCDVGVTCTCDLPPTTKKGVKICAASNANAEEAIALEIKKRVPNVDSVAVVCSDTGETIAPKEIVTDVELKPLAWGDKTCNTCIHNKCHQQANDCFFETFTCHCLEQCQVGTDQNNFVTDLSMCGCEQTNSVIYENLSACANNSCREECFPTVLSCDSCK